MKHKVGDKVRIKSKEWFDKHAKHRGSYYSILPKPADGQHHSFVDSMREYCGREAIIASVDTHSYNIDLDREEDWHWEDWMFED